jgi:hypothetical protein
MGLDDPNFDGNLNEVIGIELADINLDEDTQRQNEKDCAEQKRANDLAERKRKRELAKERERANKELAAEREREEKAYAYVPPKYDLSPSKMSASGA